MRIFKQIALILLFYIVGEVLSFLVLSLAPSVFIPSSILGMLLLLIAMAVKLIKVEDVDELSSFLTTNMSFFFIPAAVSVLEFFDILAPIWWQIFLLIVGSAFISFFAVAYSVKLTIYIQARLKDRQVETR